MTNSLYNILVPVDFTARNEWAIAKAIELANSFHCNIHLVHVVSMNDFTMAPFEMGYYPAYDYTSDIKQAGEQLIALKEHYQDHLCSDGKIEISLLHGSTYKQLSQYITQYQMDLVVVGLSRFNLFERIWSSVSISRLARKANAPVLAVRSSGLVHHFKKIVLPLSDHIPISRIRLAALLGRHFKSTIYLVSLRKQTGEYNLPVLNKTLEVIQSITTVPVQSILLEGKNLAASTLAFAAKINADLIMINPIRDFCLPGLWNRLTRKLLSYRSKIPVLTVEQQ